MSPTMRIDRRPVIFVRDVPASGSQSASAVHAIRGAPTQHLVTLFSHAFAPQLTFPVAVAGGRSTVVVPRTHVDGAAGRLPSAPIGNVAIRSVSCSLV